MRWGIILNIAICDDNMELMGQFVDGAVFVTKNRKLHDYCPVPNLSEVIVEFEVFK